MLGARRCGRAAALVVAVRGVVGRGREQCLDELAQGGELGAHVLVVVHGAAEDEGSFEGDEQVVGERVFDARDRAMGAGPDRQTGSAWILRLHSQQVTYHVGS